MDAEACRISEDVYYCAIHLPSHIKWLLQIQPSSNDGIILQKLISHHFLSSSPWFCTLSFPLGNCSLDIAVHHRGWLVGVDLQHCHVYIRDSHGWLSYPIQSRHNWYTVFFISHPVSQASTSFLILAYISEASGAAFYRLPKNNSQASSSWAATWPPWVDTVTNPLSLFCPSLPSLYHAPQQVCPTHH